MTMKVRIEDKEALDALSWQALKAYLDRAGWKHAKDLPGKGAIYKYKGPDRRLREIAVPLRRDFADYAARMGDAVGTLGRVENRSELDVYEDLRTLGAKLESGATKDAEPTLPEVDDAARAVHERIRKWLAEEGWHVRDVNDPQSSFNVMATIQSGANVNIFQYREHFDRITLSQHCVFDDRSQNEITQLPMAVQRNTVYSIYRDVSIMGLDLTGLIVPSTEMTIRTYVYFDGLTKDTFMQRILLTIRALSISLRTFVHALEERGHSVQVDQANSPAGQAAIEEAGYSVDVEETDDPTESPSNVIRFRAREKTPAGDGDSRTIAS